jgi:NDP-sugar pyrophosphorylase family protein
MKAVVLAGGYATRLRPISYALPKHLFPILGKPVIERTLDMLRQNGVSEVILALNYMADRLRAHLGTRYRNIRIRYSIEDEPLGTGGPIKFASKFLRPEETFVAMNGDVLADFYLPQMVNLHRARSAEATLALKKVRDPSRFGVAVTDSSGRIRRFVEKPLAKKAPSRLINAGFYVMNRSILGKIARGRKVIIEREVFPRLARAGRLFGMEHRGYWFDVGDLQDFIKANFYFLAKHTRDRRFVPKDCQVNKSAVIRANTILGRKNVVGGRCRIANSVFFDRVSIGSDSIVYGAVVADNVAVGEDVVISPGCIVSSGCRIADRVKLGRDVIVHPYKEISGSITKPGHVL